MAIPSFAVVFSVHAESRLRPATVSLMNGPLFRFHRPDERLRSYISAYFFADFSGGPPVDVLMYPEWAHIRIALTGVWRIQIGETVSTSPETWSVISGPTSRGVLVHAEPPATTISIGLLPLGWARLIRRSAALHADRLDPLASVFPGAATSLRQAVLDAGSDEAICAVLDKFFLELEAADSTPVSPLLVRMHEMIRDPATRTVEQLAAALGRSDRQLSRLSRDVFGFSPKLLLRRQRFVRSLIALHDNPNLPWKSLTDPGYHDHSHFVRDFRQFMGMSPSRFQALSRLHVDRVAQVRMLQLGVPHQTLQAGSTPEE